MTCCHLCLSWVSVICHYIMCVVLSSPFNFFQSSSLCNIWQPVYYYIIFFGCLYLLDKTWLTVHVNLGQVHIWHSSCDGILFLQFSGQFFFTSQEITVQSQEVSMENGTKWLPLTISVKCASRIGWFNYTPPSYPVL